MTSAAKPVILCVDDEPRVLTLIKQCLADGGYEARTADSGPAALQAIQQEKPDLILLDIHMPGMDGYTLCAGLQENDGTAQIPVVFVTGLGGEQDRTRALAAGGVGYVQKPFAEQALLDTIRTHLRTSVQWKALSKKGGSRTDGIQPADFVQFKDYLSEQLRLAPEKKAAVAKMPPAKLYALAPGLGLTDQRMAHCIAVFLKLPYLDRINPEEIRLGALPASFCRLHQVVAIGEADAPPSFVLSNPFDWELLDALKRCSGPGQSPRLLITEPETIAALLGVGASSGTARPGSANAPAGDTDGNLDYNLLASVVPEGEAESDLESEYEVLNPYQMAKIGKLPPIVRLVNMVLSDAVKVGASDIHIEPQEKVVQVRYRVDGTLQDALKIPKHLQPNTLSRFKIIAGMDIAEHRKPQDGRSRLRIEDRCIDLRVSTLPTQFGEKVVIRLLDSAKGLVELDQLGLASDRLQLFQRLLSCPQGMILVTGPTGSGKTSTLYSALNWLKSATKNIITLEDPIEFKITGLNQVQINTRTGMTFAAGLRSILRQDPNIVLVGEIRDQETASIALDAAQTGHLLLSTLHTNDAVATITRLLDLGIEPFKVGASVIGILAQRLVRRVCPACAVEREPSPEVVKKAGGRDRLPAGAQWKAGAGCEACQQSGYKGRVAIHELLEVTEPIRGLISGRSPDHVIREAVRRAGMRTMMEDGIAKAAQGLTTLEEVTRVAPHDDAPATNVSAQRNIGKPARAALPETSGSAKTSILILDDDQDTQTLLKRILEKSGYETTVASDGIEALLYLGKKDFDLILSDINMPNLDGLKLLELNNQKGITVPVIFLTAQSGENCEQQCLELGAVDFIKKPFQKDILLLRVERALDRRMAAR
jgi:type IV pilus assembly protein PilB